MGLSEDLALALSAESIRIERLPGRASVGIEVPNPGGRRGHRAARRRRVERFQGSPSLLTLALGKDIHGEPVVDDLRAMPHLLIAGTTGVGQERRPQRADHLDPLQGAARRGEADPHRPEDGRARDLRGPPAPGDADHHRPEEGGERPAVGGRADGGPLPDARRLRPGAQRRAVQRGDQGPRGGRRASARSTPTTRT